MIRLKDFIKLLKPGYRLDLYINDKTSISCDIDFAQRIFENDSRGELLVNEQSVEFREKYSNIRGQHEKTVTVYCTR